MTSTTASSSAMTELQDLSPTSEETEAARQWTAPPAPSTPPPPRLPQGWLAEWSPEHGAYYFWHEESGDAVWDPPQLSSSAMVQEVAITAKETALRRERSELVTKVCNITGLEDRSTATALLEEHDWDLERSVRTMSQRAEVQRAAEVAKKKAELEARRREAELEKARREAAAAQAAAERARAEQEEAARRRQQEEQERLRIEASQQQAASASTPLGRYVCIRHWTPKAGIEGCLRIFRGERVDLLWSQGESGWAHVKFVAEDQVGYVPLDVLQADKRIGKQRSEGEICRVLEPFDSPQEVGGFLSLAAGDQVRILSPVDEPCVWAYGERIHSQSHPVGGKERGWLPEFVLC
eukprot:TRINITY_DN113850_c0_g1_i1.p1 TRINITY_DN113850_c0_g1~~TRINITY_DN113850_c0_g1_i1.p1  ORF type:complete len:408 (-),score=80.61 TRINITY_DN113850_c0_g1_i1:184-1239(-)